MEIHVRALRKMQPTNIFLHLSTPMKSIIPSPDSRSSPQGRLHLDYGHDHPSILGHSLLEDYNSCFCCEQLTVLSFFLVDHTSCDANFARDISCDLDPGGGFFTPWSFL